MYASIIQHPKFSGIFDNYFLTYPRLDDVLADIDWNLAREPRQGAVIEDSCRVYKTNPTPDTPSFWILYEYDEALNQVTLLSMRPVPKLPEF